MDQLKRKKVSDGEAKKKKVGKVILTSRDVDILEFVFDMKFVSVKDVYERFFKVTLSGEPAKSMDWAVRRLQQLEKAGYLKGKFSFSERTKYYLGTFKGYYQVSNIYPERVFTKPLAEIDHRTFNHDKQMVEARIKLENSRAASSWISDRKLRSSKELAGGLTNSNVPDAIYLGADSKRVSLELEMSVKAKSEYREKIKKYISMLRSKDNGVKVFDKVLYVCARPSSYEFLKNEVSIYGDLFEVRTFFEFFERDPETRRY